jgi:5-methylcytosine-specific restriction protein A
MPRAPKHCGKHDCLNLVVAVPYCPEHRRTASSKATSQRRWKEKVVPAILLRDNHLCQLRYQGICTGVATTADKIIPAAQRPDLVYVESNLQAACQPCNQHKGRTDDRTG